MHLGFEAGDVAVAKVLAQLVDLLQLQKVDAQHLDCLHHLCTGTMAEFKASPFSTNQKKPKRSIFSPEVHPRAHPSALLHFFSLHTPAISVIPRGENSQKLPLPSWEFLPMPKKKFDAKPWM